MRDSSTYVTVPTPAPTTSERNSPPPPAGYNAPSLDVGVRVLSASSHPSESSRSSQTTEHEATVSILDAADALPAMQDDVADAKEIQAWIYLIDEDFFREVFGIALATKLFFAVADHRQKRTLQELMATYRNFRPKTWSWNRTLHDKTILLPSLQVTWLLTHNLTRGSWTLSQNRAARIKSAGVTKRLATIFTADWNRARTVLPSTSR